MKPSKTHNQTIIIGIDPGVHTGICRRVKKTNELSIDTLSIHRAMWYVYQQVRLANDAGNKVIVRVEDARLRKWYGNNSLHKAQGAGSIKRDCKIWDDYLSDLKKQYRCLIYLMAHPVKGGTKVSEESFRKISGYQGKMLKKHTHAIDAYFQIASL